MDTKANFIVKVVRELLKYEFSVLLYNTDQLADACGGWCSIDEDEKEFAVAMKHHMGFEILIHGYCHFLQWRDDRKLWDRSMATYDILFNWISYPSLVASSFIKDCKITTEQLDQSLHDILEIEHDCEKRVLKLVKNNPIEDFDTDQYIRATNAYLWSYHINRELRMRPSTPIYSKDLLEHMPNIFNPELSYYLDKKNLTESMRQALLAEYEQS
jgi:hypothetical protein